MPLSLIITLIAAALVGVFVAEFLTLRKNNKHVYVSCDVNMRLTEPDEIMVLRYRVGNTGFWPLPFVMISFVFDDGVEVREDEEWLKAHRVGGMFGRMYCIRMGLRPHRALEGRLRISIRERGIHRLGKIYVETGDFLGFRSRFRSCDIPGSVVCTARFLEEEPQLEPLGGFLGDVSVRRFILEDPCMVLGYREYTGAEPLKQISWLQTARTGQLTVKNHDFTVDVDVAVVVLQEACAEEVAEHCLSLTRTVCERLEEAKIPYAVLSNGDLFETAKGAGRTHSFEIQRRIGCSRFVRYRRAEDMVDRWTGTGLSSRGWIVIAPRADAALDDALKGLRAASDVRLCLLTGEGGIYHA